MDEIQQAINNNNVENLKKAVRNYAKQNPDPQGAFFFLGMGANGVGANPTWLSYLFYNTGNECGRVDNYSLAVAMYEEALKEGFKNPSVYNNMAASYKRMDNYKKALECFHYIIDNFPDYTSVYGRIAIFLKTYNVKNSKPPKEYLMEFFRLGGNIDMLQDFVIGNHPNEMVALKVLLDDYYDDSNNSRFSSEKLSSAIHTKIAGVTFEGRQKYVSLLKCGERLLLLREPYNPHDSNAIAVSNLRNNILGHIPKELAAKLALLIDSGNVYEAVVEEITGGNNYTYGCNIIIYDKSSGSPIQTNVKTQPINVNKNIDVTGWTLLTAAEKGEVEIVKKLIYQGANVNAEGSCNLTPLHWAAYKGNKEITEILIYNSADVNAKDSSDRTPLHSAVEGGNKEIAEMLISKGADVNAKDNFIGNTPLHFASQGGHKELVKLLISKGANVNAKDKNGPTPLLLAIDNSRREGYDKEIIKILISNGANVNTEDQGGETPLYWGLRLGNKELAEILISNGANINAEDNSGKTPLHWIIEWGNKDICRLLILKGANVNVKDNNGRTPLHWAAYKGNKELAEILISKGADVNAKDNSGNTPLNRAYEKNHQNVADLLISKGATKKDGCFITTATCLSLHKPDDCYELKTFRNFRDNWLRYQSDGENLITEYYTIAPTIVDYINKMPYKDEIYKSIWTEYLSKCLLLIEDSRHEEAKKIYINMVYTLLGYVRHFIGSRNGA